MPVASIQPRCQLFPRSSSYDTQISFITNVEAEDRRRIAASAFPPFTAAKAIIIPFKYLLKKYVSTLFNLSRCRRFRKLRYAHLAILSHTPQLTPISSCHSLSQSTSRSLGTHAYTDDLLTSIKPSPHALNGKQQDKARSKVHRHGNYKVFAEKLTAANTSVANVHLPSRSTLKFCNPRSNAFKSPH